MSLQQKFALLLCAVGLTVLVSLGAAMWSVRLVDRELAQPWADIQRVMAGLNALKRAVGDLNHRLSGPVPEPWHWDPADDQPHAPDDVPGTIRRLAAVIEQHLEQLEQDAAYRWLAGIGTAANVRMRVDRALSTARAWLDSDDPDAHDAAWRATFELHELIEAIEARILEGAELRIAFGRQMRTAVGVLLGAAVVTLVLAGYLAVGLMRRWVLRPVQHLRVAADRFASGDLSHRVPVEGRDEIASLSAEVNTMADTIVRMQAELVERERLAAIGAMVRRIAHNLRDPLSGVRSLAELSRAELDAQSTADPAHQHVCRAMIRANQERIIQTVDRFEQWLQNLVRATQPMELRREPTPVAPWIEAVMASIRPMAESQGVAIELDAADAPDQATFDAQQLEQALVAVVTNAVQVCPRDGRVTVRVTHQGEDGQWRIVVADTGPGIRPEHMDRIFEPYFTTRRGGTGIGLAVARQVVEQHGGRIRARNRVSGPAPADQPPAGAEFEIRLPMGPGRDRPPAVAENCAGVASRGQNSGH